MSALETSSVTETDSGVKAGSFSVCDTCFRSLGSGGLSQRRNVGKTKQKLIAPPSKCCSVVLCETLIADMAGRPAERG